MTVKKIILVSFWLTCFFPFVSPVVLNSDLQPLNLLFTLLWYLYIKINNKKISLDELIIIGFMVLFILYINPNEDMSKFNISKYISFGLALFIPLLFSSTNVVVSKGAFKVALFIYSGLSIMHFAEPDVLFLIQSKIINIRNDFYLIGRGISPLSPEPSFFAAVIFSMMFINEYLFEMKKISKKSFFIYLTCMMTMMAMNKSGSAVIYSLFYLSLSGKLGIVRYIGLILLPLIALWYLSNASESSRVLTLVGMFLSGDYLLAGDVSFSNRIADFSSGLISFLHSPIGVTPTMVSDQLSYIGYEYNISKYINNQINGVTSSVSYGLISYGLFFIFWLFYIFNKFKTKLKYKMASLLLMSFSVSYAFPLIWVLMLLGDSDKEK